MALYTKPDMSVLWAQTGAVDAPTTIKLAQGWVSEIPPYEVQNWWQLRADQAIRHIFESGIPEWDNSTVYTGGRSIVQGSNGNLYRAIIDNVGQNPLITTAWQPLIDPLRFTQPGTVVYSAGGTLPGHFHANGAAVSRSAYPELFAIIGTTYGAGDGSTTFNLPDLRGVFIRGADDGKGIDIGRVLGSLQQSANLQHSHSGTATSGGGHNHVVTVQNSGNHSHSGQTFNSGEHAHSFPAMEGPKLAVSPGFPNFVSQPGGALNTSPAGNHFHHLSIDANGAHSHGTVVSVSGEHTHTITTNSVGTNESRPINVALRPCIKY